MRDVFADVLGVSGDTEVHATEEIVHLFSNVMAQRNACATSSRKENILIANALDAVRCLHDIACRCQRATEERVNATAVAELGVLCAQTADCKDAKISLGIACIYSAIMTC